MYELKKIGKVLTSKSVGTEPLSYEKKNLPGRGLTKVEKHCLIPRIADWLGPEISMDDLEKKNVLPVFQSYCVIDDRK